MPIVFNIPMLGTIAHQAPSTTVQARHPPSGQSALLLSVSCCRLLESLEDEVGGFMIVCQLST